MFVVIVGTKSELKQSRAVPLAPSAFTKRLQEEMPNCKIVMEVSAYEDMDSVNRLFN